MSKLQNLGTSTRLGRSYIDLIFCPRVERKTLPVIFLSSAYINNVRDDPDAHFGYVCSDLSMNRGAFDAGDYEWSMFVSSLPMTTEAIPREQTR